MKKKSLMAALAAGVLAATVSVAPAQAASITVGGYCSGNGALRSQLIGDSTEHRWGNQSGRVLGAWSFVWSWTTKQTSTGVTGNQAGWAWGQGGVRNVSIVCGGGGVG